MSIFGNVVFLESADIAVTTSGEPIAPPLETKTITVIGAGDGISGAEPQHYNVDTTIHVERPSPWSPASAAIMQSIGSGIGTPMEVLSNPFKNDIFASNHIRTISNDYGAAQVTPDTAIIEIGADISFDRTADGQISGFVCPGMESTGNLGGGGGQGKNVYDIRYKRNLIKF